MHKKLTVLGSAAAAAALTAANKAKKIDISSWGKMAV